MNTLSLLDVMAVQRHDFLNHLQVIFGLVQLDKGDKVKEYITKITQDFETLHQIIHLKHRYMAAALLLGLQQAQQEEIQVNIHIQSLQENGDIYDEVLVDALYGFFCAILQEIAQKNEMNREMDFYWYEESSRWYCKYVFPFFVMEESAALPEALSHIKQVLLSYGGDMETHHRTTQAEVEISVPLVL